MKKNEENVKAIKFAFIIKFFRYKPRLVYNRVRLITDKTHSPKRPH